MRASVSAAWPAFCRSFEGVCYWLYFDTKNLATTGTGNMIDAGGRMSDLGFSLPWKSKAGEPASRALIAHEYDRLKALGIYRQGGYAYEKYAALFIDQATVDRLLADKTAEFWARLGQTVTRLEQAPADAQLCLIDLAWQNGPGFLDLRKDGDYVWKGTRAAVLAGDWAAAAGHVPGTGRRADTRRRLFSNAAAVVRLGIDPNILWLDRTPVKPPAPTPDLEDEIMAMTPAQRAQLVDEIATRVVSKLLYTDAVPAPEESKTNPTWKGISFWHRWTLDLEAIKAKLGVR